MALKLKILDVVLGAIEYCDRAVVTYCERANGNRNDKIRQNLEKCKCESVGLALANLANVK